MNTGRRRLKPKCHNEYQEMRGGGGLSILFTPPGSATNFIYYIQLCRSEAPPKCETVKCICFVIRLYFVMHGNFRIVCKRAHALVCVRICRCVCGCVCVRFRAGWYSVYNRFGIGILHSRSAKTAGGGAVNPPPIFSITPQKKTPHPNKD